MTKAFYKPAFRPDSGGHGGERRSFQIKSLLCEHFDLIDANGVQNAFETPLKRYFRGWRFLLGNGLRLRSLRNISMAGFWKLNFDRLVGRHPSIKHYFWEPASDYTDYLIPYLCKAHGIRVVAFPHNLESLAFGRISWRSGSTAPNWLMEEIEVLRSCHFVVTISLEEQWLLQLFSVGSLCLPYQPAEEELERLLEIRNSRSSRMPDDFFLVLGSFTNPPTRQGILEIIDFLKESRCLAQISIAGYGTEELKKIRPGLPANVRVMGTLDSGILTDVLVRCRAVIINQRFGTGALTRLTELAIAGIPVVANTTALRSHHHLRGFVEFEDLSLLEGIENMEFDIPEVPRGIKENLMKTLERELGME